MQKIKNKSCKQTNSLQSVRSIKACLDKKKKKKSWEQWNEYIIEREKQNDILFLNIKEAFAHVFFERWVCIWNHYAIYTLLDSFKSFV